jgi:hypothetical protein
MDPETGERKSGIGCLSHPALVQRALVVRLSVGGFGVA